MNNIEDAAHPRKRSRTSNDSEDVAATYGGKKARGRPRVDTQDATAADRRRTQIRLAQRAYRQRKETTITSLKQQSSHLHSVIDQMNQTFMRFSDLATKSGFLRTNSQFAKEFKQMADTFTNCVKTANEHTLDSDEEEIVQSAPQPEKQSNIATTMTAQYGPPQTATPPETEQAWSYAKPAQTSEQSHAQVEAPQPGSYFSHISSSVYTLPDTANRSGVPRRYQFTVGEVLDQSRSLDAPYQLQSSDQPDNQQQQPRRPQQQHPPLPFGLVDLPSREQSPFIPPYIFPVNVPAMGTETVPLPLQKPSISNLPSTPLITSTLAPVFTYSYNEVTFARRLTRATMEVGFDYLSAPNVPPEIPKHVFKLSLPYSTLEEIRNRFKIILSRGVDEDLDWWATPFIHLGGAGTHYQRRDAQGNIIPMKNSWTVRQIGPMDKRLLRLANALNGESQDLEGVDLGGLEGEWFDAYDVQGYLEEQWHCKIDPRSSFAECLVEDENDKALDNESESRGLSSGSTTTTDVSITPPITQPFRSFKPSYGLDMTLNNAPTPDLSQGPLKEPLLDLSYDQTLGLDLAPGFDMGFAGNHAYSMLNLNMMETEQLPVVSQKKKRLAWVDISKLIDNLIKNAVCLGRGPGYRQKDVDVAFREALLPGS